MGQGVVHSLGGGTCPRSYTSHSSETGTESAPMRLVRGTFAPGDDRSQIEC